MIDNMYVGYFCLVSPVLLEDVLPCFALHCCCCCCCCCCSRCSKGSWRDVFQVIQIRIQIQIQMQTGLCSAKIVPKAKPRPKYPNCARQFLLVCVLIQEAASTTTCRPRCSDCCCCCSSSSSSSLTLRKLTISTQASLRVFSVFQPNSS